MGEGWGSSGVIMVIEPVRVLEDLGGLLIVRGVANVLKTPALIFSGSKSVPPEQKGGLATENVNPNTKTKKTTFSGRRSVPPEQKGGLATENVNPNTKTRKTMSFQLNVDF